MIVTPNVSSSRVVLVELEILLTVLAVGAWGGFVSFLMNKETTEAHKNIMNCLAQITISCFTGFILSMVAIGRNMSFHMIVLAAGLGGVFATPILRTLGEKIRDFFSRSNFFK